jgi:tRNA U34 5-methylaminomethyl-2-thiouridine-forming methyltransferase MnmC
LEKFELVTLKSGLKSLRAVEFGETFHPVTGPLIEARILHVEQQRLVERARKSSTEKSASFVIWDIGFGAGANALTAANALAQENGPIEIHSFDKNTDSIVFALENREELGYLVPYENEIRELVEKRVISFGKNIRWYFHLGDFRELDKSLIPPPDSILFDPYSPKSNPEMWTLDFFTGLSKLLSDKVPCLWTNYSRSTSVRVALLLAGFFVGIGTEVGEKAETTIASNDFNLIERPLDKEFLLKAKRSTNSAPLRSQSYGLATISAEDLQKLAQHPQFN